VASPFDINLALRRPPHSRGSGTSNQIVWLETTDDQSTPALDVLQGADLSYLLIRFEALTPPDVATAVIGFCVFGPAGLAAASDVNGWPVIHGEVWEWSAVAPFDSCMRLIRAESATDTNIRARLYLTDRRA
jgi:hypothetical protein